MLFINFTYMVGASLDIMDKDTARMRVAKPYVFTNMKDKTGLAEVIAFIEKQGLLI